MSGEPGEVRPGAADQLPAAASAGLNIDRHAGRGQCFEIAASGGDRNLELFGDSGSGDLPASLQEEQQGEKSVCAHRRSLSSKVLTR